MIKISKAKTVLLAISIALVLAFFIGYGINTFYNVPKYEDFCEGSLIRKIITTEEDCLEAGGQWSVNPETDIVEGKTTIEGFCNPDYTCRKEFEDAREKYQRNFFIISVILGLIAVVLGGIFLKLESVSSGIMGGGILIMIFGTLQYWGNLADIGRFIILGIALAVLMWVGYTKFKK